MNHKQKLGYILLGAGIMAIGITIGQFVTPDIEAQSNGVFDVIQCRKIEVIDKYGKRAVILVANEDHNGLVINDKHGKVAIDLAAFEEGNKITVSNANGNIGVGLTSHKKAGNGVSVHNQYGKSKIWLSVDETGNSINIMDWVGNIKWSAP